MKILILSNNPTTIKDAQTKLPDCDILQRSPSDDLDAVLAIPDLSLCVIELQDQVAIEPAWMIERIRRRNLNIKIVVVGEVSADWQVSLLQKGASQLLLPPTPWAALPELLFPNQTKTARTLKEKQPLTKPSPKVQAESLIDLLKYTNSADELSQALVQATKYALGINKTALFLVQGDILIPTHATGHLPQEIAPSH